VDAINMRVKILLFLLCLYYLPAFAFASENIRVVLENNRKTVVIQSRSGFIAENSSINPDQRKLNFKASSTVSSPVRLRSSSGFIQVNGRSYRGWVEIRKKRNGMLMVINDLDIEDYLRGVLASEIPPGWKYEALKAQAVAARTYALYQKKTAGRRPYDIAATVNSQVYAGSEAERPREARAVEDTKGFVIVYRGEIIPAFFHSSCGGQTENAAALWGIDAPYLKGVDCECQQISQYGLWEKRINTTQIIKALRKQGFIINDILGISIRGITPAGRVKEVAIRSSRGEFLIPAESLRAAIGNTVVPSVFFELELDGNEAVFSGRGSGHGVGLCQWGAEEMAERGYDFKAILSHYYPGTNIIQLN
jgi:stage II sporulation protein D (peptidoglycan lytic transglycosylase)